MRPIKSVTEINAEIRQLLETDYRFVRIRGEISNVRKPYSGHYYFILKDEHSQLNAVLFKNQQRWLAQKITDGQEVICDGRIGVYEARGQYQLIVDTVDFDGTGQLQILFEQLKQRLRSEGLFDPAHKSGLPETVKNIVVITSPTGAAIHDFLSICRKRNAQALIKLLPVRVQGKDAVNEICDAIDTAHMLNPDVIVLCRGGGSIEDLWAFNEEKLAWAIHRATIPIVTGIGHETDFTIADFCADIRCPTPTGTAELIIADPQNRIDRIEHLRARLLLSAQRMLDEYQTRVDTSARLLSTFDDAFSSHTYKVDYLSTRLNRAFLMGMEKEEQRCTDLEARMRRTSPENKIRWFQQRLEHLFNQFTAQYRQLHESKQNKLLRCAAVLDTLSPLKTLARGYSVVSLNKNSDSHAKIITRATQVHIDDTLDIRLHSGELACKVIEKRESD